MDISVITITWNAEEHVENQIKSVVSGCKDISFEQIIVDNGSSDNTVELIKNKFILRHSERNDHAKSAGSEVEESQVYSVDQRDPSTPLRFAQDDAGIVLIENKENKGFGVANNQGVGISNGEFLLFLNPDMKVEEGSLDKIVQWMREHEDVGMVSPKLVDEHGKLNRDATPRRFPRVWEMVAMILKLPHIFPSTLNKYLMKDFGGDVEQEVDSVRGSFMLVRREIVEKLGWAFDPRYFIWFEDVDTCREVKRLGYKVMYTPIISCVDYVGQSFKKRESLWKQKNFTRSMLTYFQKWEPWYKWIWIALFRPVGIGFVWTNNIFHKK